MVYCGEGECTTYKGKKHFVSKWPGRNFIRFYQMPNPKKRKDMFKKWKSRVRRRPEEISHKTMICSEHFCEEDFNLYDLSNIQRLVPTTRVWIRLKEDAVPNTDRTTGKKRVQCPSDNSGSTTRRGRKRVRRDIDYIDQLISENEAVIGSSTKVQDESEDSAEAAVDVEMDRYLALLISADTDTSKGVQCSPAMANYSTQAGLSSLILTKQRTR